MSTIQYTTEALRNIEETGCDPARDVARLRSGEITSHALLDFCLDGADTDREIGWCEYVDTCVVLAGDPADYVTEGEEDVPRA